jgi:hypothetical protein
VLAKKNKKKKKGLIALYKDLRQMAVLNPRVGK